MFTLVGNLLLAQILMIIISVLFMESFPALLESDGGRKLYSTVTGAMFFCTYYSKAWKAGKKDFKSAKIYNNHHDDKIRINYFKGVTAGIIAHLPCLILISLHAVKLSKGYISSGYNLAYRILNSHFIGWLGNDNLTYIPNCLILTAATIILGGVAYFAGTKEFSVTERYLPMLVYKNGGKENKNK
jgi:hypothetical protein